MQETMDTIIGIINDYNSSSNHNPEGLLDLGRSLSAHLFFLEKYRSDAHKRFQARVKSLKDEGWKVNAAENEANVEIPELYELRRFMESAEKVLGMIRSELSWLKTEMQNTNISG